MDMKAKRKEVYDAIDVEREYQDKMHHHGHSVLEFAVFMRTYLEELFSKATHGSDPMAKNRALETIRKVVALGVACMEQHGAPHRKLNDTLDPGPR